ncbi:hypothetical protein STEG23_014602 [Scotinomys teguina]
MRRLVTDMTSPWRTVLRLTKLRRTTLRRSTLNKAHQGGLAQNRAEEKLTEVIQNEADHTGSDWTKQNHHRLCREAASGNPCCTAATVLPNDRGQATYPDLGDVKATAQFIGQMLSNEGKPTSQLAEHR